MKMTTKTILAGLILGATLGGCVVEDKEPGTTVIDPPNTTVIKEDRTPDVIVNPPATTTTTGN